MQTSHTIVLSPEQQETLIRVLREGNYRPLTVPYTRIAVETAECKIALYQSGKCVAQGKGATDFVTFVLEPLVLGAARLGYEDVLDPEATRPHMGVDESGKGDFFGPMVISAAYVDPVLAEDMRALGVRDSKKISSDKVALDMARELRRMLGARFSLVAVGPAAYNRLYAKMRSVNALLSWGHARAIENLLAAVPDCPRAISDQFGNPAQVRRALMGRGRGIELVQRHRAESDLAVAAASVLARAGFLQALKRLEEQYGQPFLKGASAEVRKAAERLVRARGERVLLETAKCHFRTTDQVLAAVGKSRAALGPEGAAVSRAAREPKSP